MGTARSVFPHARCRAHAQAIHVRSRRDWRPSPGCQDLRWVSDDSSKTIWPDSGLKRADFLRPFNAFFKATRAQQIGGTGDEPDNQLASIFARWAFPRAGVEVYGEFGREDYNADLPDLIGEPDHDASYMLGIQRVWKRGTTELLAVRGEVLNTRMTSLNVVRQQTPFYEAFTGAFRASPRMARYLAPSARTVAALRTSASTGTAPMGSGRSSGRALRSRRATCRTGPPTARKRSGHSLR